jgi:Uma2 family endonuclease
MKTGPGLPGRAPDVCFLSSANLHRLKKNHIDGPADLVVEIVSLESIERDYVTKFAEYAQGGLGEYWIADPLQQTARFSCVMRQGRFRKCLRMRRASITARSCPVCGSM